MIWLREKWRPHHFRCKIWSEINEICMLRATGYQGWDRWLLPKISFFWWLRRCGSLWRIRLLSDSLDTCGRKPYPERKVADSKISGYVWTGSKAVKFVRRGAWFENVGIVSMRLSTLRQLHCEEFWLREEASLLKVKEYIYIYIYFLQFCFVWSSYLPRIINILQVLDQHFVLFEAGKVAALPRFCKRPNLVSSSFN